MIGSHDPGTEVVIMNSLTANLHHDMVAFYWLTATRQKVFMELQQYAGELQIRFHGYDPAVSSLVTVDPQEVGY